MKSLLRGRVAYKDLQESAPFELKWLNPPPSEESCEVENYIHRPGLLLAGYVPEDNKERHILVFGRDEFRFLNGLSEEKIRELLVSVWKLQPPLVILCGKVTDVPPYLLEDTQKFCIPVASTPISPSEFLGVGFRWIERLIAPRTRVNGVLIRVFDLGVLIVGESGVGKSECALELMVRGHRIVADDAVDIICYSNGELVGTAPKMAQGLMEIRGLGVVDTRILIGPWVYQPNTSIDLVIELTPAKYRHQLDRITDARTNLDTYVFPNFDVTRPKISLPVILGRNIGVLVEMAVRWFLLRHLQSVRVEDLFHTLDEEEELR